MLKIELDGEKCFITADGSLKDICSGTGQAISAIHDALRRADPPAAKLFREAITLLVLDPGSPLWNKPSDGSVMIDLSHVKRGEGKLWT